MSNSGVNFESLIPSSVVNSSQAGGKVVIEEIYLKPYLNAIKVEKEEDVTTEMQVALEVANAANATLVLPNRTIKLAGTVSLGNVTNKGWRMRGSGPGSIILDANTAGPCLEYKRTESFGRPKWRDFIIKPAVNKPAFAMVVFSGLTTSHIEMSNIVWQQSGSFKIFAGLIMENMWEGSFNDCAWVELQGHSVWWNCPTLNGGNIAFNDCQDQFCSNGMVIKGASTINNVQFKNMKFVSAQAFAEGNHEFYEKLVAGIPAVGEKEITIASGLSLEYFRANGMVLLYSAAGLDIMHLATEEPYNATTGILKFRDATVKKHNEYSDLRVLSHSTWALTTDFTTRNIQALCCHFEQRGVFLKDAPNADFLGTQVSCVSNTNTGEAHPIWLAGPQSIASRFVRTFFSHKGGVEEIIKAAVVTPLAPEPRATSGTPAFEVDIVSTFPSGKANMENEEYRPFWSPDAVYQSLTEYPQNIRVRTGSKGLERDSFGWGRVYSGKSEKTTGEEHEASKVAGVMLSLVAVCKAVTRTQVEVLVGGKYAHGGIVSAAATGTTDIPMTVFVPLGVKWEAKVIEGTVEKLFASQIPFG